MDQMSQAVEDVPRSERGVYRDHQPRMLVVEVLQLRDCRVDNLLDVVSKAIVMLHPVRARQQQAQEHRGHTQ